MFEIIIVILLFLILLAILGHKREADGLLGFFLLIPVAIISFLFEILLFLFLAPFYIIGFFLPSKEKTASSKLENLKKENEELMQENKELLNKRDSLLKKLNKKV